MSINNFFKKISYIINIIIFIFYNKLYIIINNIYILSGFFIQKISF